MAQSGESRRRGLLLTGLGVLMLVAAAAVWRASRTPEWAIHFGDREARIAASRVIWQKGAQRAEAGLRRLLSDAEPAVQLAALEALSRRPIASFQAALVVLLESPDRDVAARAAECLLAEPDWDAGPAPEVVDAWTADAAWRRDHPRQLALLVAWELDHGAGADWLLARADRLAGDPKVQAVLLSRGAALAGEREALLRRLEAATPESADYALLLDLLTAIDGRRRGHSVEDWRQAVTASRAEATPPLDRFTVEAEWAGDIRPNFQIGEFGGETALLLEEGAGGYMSWLKRDNSTVDIGSGRFRFTLKTPGNYRLWARLWLENKCSNSTGMIVDGRDLGSFSDHGDIFGEWRWTSHRVVHLAAGPHVLELQAMEDGVHVDKYAFLPADETLDPASPPPLHALYDPTLGDSLSVTMPLQHMPRGTTQTVTVWVRRSTPEVTEGTVELHVPEPFTVLHGASAALEFPPDSPVARASFRVHLPADARAGEVPLRARFKAAGSDTPTTETEVALGCHFDWWCSGSMPMDSARAAALTATGGARPADLATAWQRFPREGYDPYRRLELEWALGQSQGTIAFLYTEIDVAADGDYTSLLTSDDVATIWIDGVQRLQRHGGGPAEGNLQIEPLSLTAGRHRIFVSVTQADFADPEGPDRLRHTPNNWIFKWLIRRDRHAIAPGIRGVVVTP